MNEARKPAKASSATVSNGSLSNAKLKLLSGRVHPELAAAVAKHLGVELTPLTISTFANGEICCRIDESVRGADVFVMQSHAGSINDAIFEQVLLIDAARRSSARSITAVCPFFGYARQDRKARGRQPITAAVVVSMLANAGADRIMSVDLHSGQIQGFFNGPFDHLIARPIFEEYIQKHFDSKDLVIVSPDAGRVKTAERYSSVLGCGMAIIHKHRSTTTHNQAEARHLIGEVKGKICLLMDDMIDTAGTICTAADLLHERGAREIFAFAAHGVLSDPACQRIKDSHFKKVVVTDTLPVACAATNNKIEVLSIADLLGDAINVVYTGGSMSALFHEQNHS